MVMQDATPDQLWTAITANQRSWIARNIEVSGGEVHRDETALWVYGPNGGSAILFPQFTAAQAGDRLDALLAFYRDRLPHHDLMFWSHVPTAPPDLGARLLARGFEPSWEPHWMVLDLHQTTLADQIPAGVRIESVSGDAVWDVEDLPYYQRDKTQAMSALTDARPQQVWHFAAWRDDQVVGHSVLNLTTGPLGIAGLFDVGVVPAARMRGIGKSVTIAACREAQTQGYRYLMLNATPMGIPVYRRIGFRSFGPGITWFMPAATLAQPAPTPQQVALAEAIGRGDLAALDALAPTLTEEVLEKRLANHMTPLELAASTHQTAAAEWLIGAGATLDVMSAWNLGWRDRVPELLARSPELANRRYGRFQVTPLHEAAARNDAELARVVLAAHPDLDAVERQFNGTPIGWARHIGHRAIIALIEGHQAAQGTINRSDAPPSVSPHTGDDTGDDNSP